MAVSIRERRKGLASGLLTAAEVQALAWRAQHLALYVYEDNAPAVSIAAVWVLHCCVFLCTWRRWVTLLEQPFKGIAVHR